MTMIRLGKQTTLPIAQVLEQAIRFFNSEGAGLAMVELRVRPVSSDGDGGFVTVDVRRQDGITTVDVSTQEWWGPARVFLQGL